MIRTKRENTVLALYLYLYLYLCGETRLGALRGDERGTLDGDESGNAVGIQKERALDSLCLPVMFTIEYY